MSKRRIGLAFTLLAILALFCFFGRGQAIAQTAQDDRPVLRAMERQAQAQEAQSEALKGIERHLAAIASKIR